jgi:hypothetical protein
MAAFISNPPLNLAFIRIPSVHPGVFFVNLHFYPFLGVNAIQLVFYLRFFQHTFYPKDTLKENKIITSAQELIVKLLAVQIKGSNTQFSTPLYLPPGQKKSGASGHIN